MGSCEQNLVEKLAVGAAPREQRDPHTPWVRWALDDGRAPSLGFLPVKTAYGLRVPPPEANEDGERGRRPGKECGPSPLFRARRPVPRRRPWIVITTRTEAPTLLPSFPIRFPRVARKAEPTPTRRPHSPSGQYRRQQNTSRPCDRKSRLCLKGPTETRIFWAAIGAERMHRRTDFWVKESVADIQAGKGPISGCPRQLRGSRWRKKGPRKMTS